MLARRYRLRQAADIVRVRRHGRSWRHPLLVLLVTPAAPTQLVNRFGFLASRRVGNAVRRNRAKRLMRAAVQRHFGEFGMVQSSGQAWDCLLIARTNIPDASFAEVETAVKKLLKRSQVWTSSD